MKSPQANSLTKHDIVRAIKGLINHTQLLSSRIDDLDRIIGDYIDYNKDMDKFGEHLDGKYQQPKDKPSRKNSDSSKE